MGHLHGSKFYRDVNKLEASGGYIASNNDVFVLNQNKKNKIVKKLKHLRHHIFLSVKAEKVVICCEGNWGGGRGAKRLLLAGTTLHPGSRDKREPGCRASRLKLWCLRLLKQVPDPTWH